jgi:hypothetical protein
MSRVQHDALEHQRRGAEFGQAQHAGLAHGSQRRFDRPDGGVRAQLPRARAGAQAAPVQQRQRQRVRRPAQHHRHAQLVLPGAHAHRPLAILRLRRAQQHRADEGDHHEQGQRERECGAGDARTRS